VQVDLGTQTLSPTLENEALTGFRVVSDENLSTLAVGFELPSDVEVCA